MNTTVMVEDHGTVSELFWSRVSELDDKVVIREKDFGIWNEYSWADWGRHAKLVGLGLKALGFGTRRRLLSRV